jgi:hypothetical protein
MAKGTVESLDGGQRSCVTIVFDYEARGIGKLLVPLVVRRQVKRVLPRNDQALKEILVSGTPAARSA